MGRATFRDLDTSIESSKRVVGFKIAEIQEGSAITDGTNLDLVVPDDRWAIVRQYSIRVFDGPLDITTFAPGVSNGTDPQTQGFVEVEFVSSESFGLFRDCYIPCEPSSTFRVRVDNGDPSLSLARADIVIHGELWDAGGLTLVR